MGLKRGFEVEWCAGCPVRDGETIMDAADWRFKDFADKPAAMAFAAKVLPKDFFGSVRVTEFEMQPYEPGYPGLCREHIGDPEYVD